MDFMFSSSDRKGFDLWISQQLDDNHTWEEIEDLCVPEGEFENALENLIDASGSSWYGKSFR